MDFQRHDHLKLYSQNVWIFYILESKGKPWPSPHFTIKQLLNIKNFKY